MAGNDERLEREQPGNSELATDSAEGLHTEQAAGVAVERNAVRRLKGITVHCVREQQNPWPVERAKKAP
jgi:hypothetical protein